MKSIVSLLLVFSLIASTGVPILQAADPAPQGLREDLGEAADEAGREFVEGAGQILEPFIVVGKTTIAGVSFVVFKTAEGVVYVAEKSVQGLKYVAKGAKFVVIKTAEGVVWVAEQAIKAGEIIFDAAVELTELVIDGVVYVLVKLEDGFAFVAEKAVQAGKAVIKGAKYVVHKTAEGIVWVTEKSLNAIKAGAAWTRNTYIRVRIRDRLVSALAIGHVGEDSISYFREMSVHPRALDNTKKLARAALAASLAFNEVYLAGE